jgi:hypothetical protein
MGSRKDLSLIHSLSSVSTDKPPYLVLTIHYNSYM